MSPLSLPAFYSSYYSNVCYLKGKRFMVAYSLRGTFIVSWSSDLFLGAKEAEHHDGEQHSWERGGRRGVPGAKFSAPSLYRIFKIRAIMSVFSGMSCAVSFSCFHSLLLFYFFFSPVFISFLFYIYVACM